MMTRWQTFRLAVLMGCIVALLAGCAHGPAPEPVVRTVNVEVPVYRPCPASQRLGPAPAYPDTDAALRAAPDLAARVGLLLAGRMLRTARLAADEAALQACAQAG